MSKERVSMIAALAENNRAIGKDNKLLWDIPEDTRHFRETTRGHAVIMGRKTYESIGYPLPDRPNIVVTREASFQPKDVTVVHSFEEALKAAEEKEKGEIFVIGGAQIYKQALPLADRLYLTLVEGDFEGDAFFPEYPEFKRIISERQSEGNGYKYTFVTLER